MEGHLNGSITCRRWCVCIKHPFLRNPPLCRISKLQLPCWSDQQTAASLLHQAPLSDKSTPLSDQQTAASLLGQFGSALAHKQLSCTVRQTSEQYIQIANQARSTVEPTCDVPQT
jgi:hypothetical protein